MRTKIKKEDRFKFRAWDKQLNSFLAHNEEDKTFSLHIFEDICKSDKYELLQCTGFRDRNDTLIFEGDIVSCSFISDDTKKIEYSLMIVSYINEIGAFVFKGTKFSSCFTDFISTDYIQQEYEVVGNIYENLALLENKHAN